MAGYKQKRLGFYPHPLISSITRSVLINKPYFAFELFLTTNIRSQQVFAYERKKTKPL